MSYSREERSVSPRREHPSRSRRIRSRSRDSQDASNRGNNLYITGLSTRVTAADIEKYFGNEGKVLVCNLVADPHTKESRGFAFVTMDTVEGAERCIKYLNRSVLEGRLITVEKAKRSRGRTPTPGKYQGLRDRRGQGQTYSGQGHRRSRSYSPRRNDRDDQRKDRQERSRPRSPYNRRRDDRDLSRRRTEHFVSGNGGGYRR